METKLFELRDEGTCIPLLCIKPNAGEVGWFENKVLWRYGYKGSHTVIVLSYADPARGASCDLYQWNDRTFLTAHAYVEKHWDKLKTGDVIDVSYILGETRKPKASEL